MKKQENRSVSKAEYKIGEFSAMTGLPPSKIRFYEKYGLWDVHRSNTGYRCYTPEDAFRLNAFRMLQQYGFTVEEAVHLLDEKQETAQFQAMLAQQQKKLKREQQLLQQRALVIDTIQRTLNLDHGSDFEVVDADDYLYVQASVGRNFREAQRHRDLLARMVDLLPFSMYTRILTREDLTSSYPHTDPNYTIALPWKKRGMLEAQDISALSRLNLGKCVRFSRKLNRSESVRKENFDKLFTYLKDHGYKIRGNGIIFPYFLNLDENHRDLEMVFIPIY